MDSLIQTLKIPKVNINDGSLNVECDNTILNLNMDIENEPEDAGSNQSSWPNKDKNFQNEYGSNNTSHLLTPGITPQNTPDRELNQLEEAVPNPSSSLQREGIDAANIITGPRNRKLSRRTAMAVNPDPGSSVFSFYSSFGTSMRMKLTNNETRLHRNDLPPEPKGRKTMTKYKFSK